ncbi:unnamed protein product [Rhizoctonia solani]|uniref:F-box domain-containing protein n=1 Tax=Rhizoctonia solani TaxID=456999 RepID=A0A8H3HT62_9AGAM|nr:unnamed protein product [Rhizoctonia solani]
MLTPASPGLRLSGKAAPKSRPKRKSEPKPEQESEPARKRARRLNGKRGPNADKTLGALALMSMLVEVLIEIARYVHPLDLIMLSRVNKFFRELFMDRRSALIWQSARENLPGLPPCPDNVCEPQYAAMLFTKRCSSCGGYAPREMDPALLVRLCVNCRESELVDTNRVTDATLLIVSQGIVPGRTLRGQMWCLYNEARAVKIKLNELNEAGDQEATEKWKAERRKLTTEPLRKWLRDRERERDKDLKSLKSVRQAEIESRLISLGWEQGDFVCHEGWRHKQWQSMVYSAKPLTDKIWDTILPSLLGHLEINRDQRLERERSQRRGWRRNALYTWINTTLSQLPPFARVEPIKGQHLDEGPSNSWSATLGLAGPMTLRQAYPISYHVQEWEECKALVDTDVPHEQFLAESEEKQLLLQQWIADWQGRLEKRLIGLLPRNTRLPNFTLSPFNIVVGTSKSVQPISTLPENLQKLLRADAVFSIQASGGESTPYFYPNDFDGARTLVHKACYHTKAGEIAKALLSALGSPDASYLGLAALGQTFRCGGCPPATARKYTWKGIIEHYLESISSWKRTVRQPQVQSNKDFAYVCTHDVNSENPRRPLVNTGSPPTKNRDWSYSRCMPCQTLGLSGRVYSQSIMDHLRDVHLIEEPEVGTHYKAHDL